MALKEVSLMSQPEEFSVFASVEGANLSELCGRFGVGRKTEHKWLARYVADGVESGRPVSSAVKTIRPLETIA
jgi:hypothetical protein